MTLWTAGLLALLHLYYADAASCGASENSVSTYRHPVSVSQFHEPDACISEQILPSNKFENVIEISLQKEDPLSIEEDIAVDTDRKEINVIYGKVGEYHGTFRAVHSTFWNGISKPQQSLTCDRPTVTCDIKPRTTAKGLMGVAEMGSEIPGVFQVVAKGLHDHSPKENVWRLYAIPTFVITEGRYFNISLDFVQARFGRNGGRVVVDHLVAPYLSLGWSSATGSMFLHGIPGIEEVSHLNTLGIHFHQKETCTTGQPECPQVKVNLKTESWDSRERVGPSFEATVFPKLTSADDRIEVAQCIAKLYSAHITDLRGLSFADGYHEGNKDSVAKIRGTVVSAPSDCDIATKLARMKRPSSLPECRWTLLSLRHDLSYFRDLCETLDFVGLEAMDRLDPAESVREGTAFRVSDVNRRLKQISTTLPAEMEAPVGLPPARPSADTEVPKQGPSGIIVKSYAKDLGVKSIYEPHQPADNDNLIPYSQDTAEASIYRPSRRSNPGRVSTDASETRRVAKPSPISVEALDINEVSSRNPTANDLSESGEDPMKPTLPPPSWSQIRDASYQSRQLHLAIVLSVVSVAAVIAFVSVFCWYRRRVRLTRRY